MICETVPAEDAKSNSRSSTAIYVLGITPAIDDAPSKLTSEFIDDIQAIRRGSLTTWQGTVKTSEFCRVEGEANLANIQWVAPRAIDHERLVRAIHDRTTICPARFATLFQDDQLLDRQIESYQSELNQFFASCQFKDEWSVVVNLDRAKAIENYRQQDRSRETSSTASTGRSYLASRRRNLFDDAQWQSTLKAALSDVQATLATIADRLVLQRPIQESAPANQLERVASFTLLVDRHAIQQLEAFASHWTQEFGNRQGIHLALSGPWPLFTFSREFAFK